jgi:hypothetical protein
MQQIHRHLGLAAMCAAILACDAGPPDPGEPAAITDRAAAACGYRTQTQSDWGGHCWNGDAGSVACLRDAHFDEAFYEGLIVGCGVLTANLVTSSAVEYALPTGGKARALHPSEAGAFDGKNDPTVETAFFGHVVALALNLEFDELPDYNPNHPGPRFADLVVADPDSPCVGMTVYEVFLEASAALGDCPAVLEPKQLIGCVGQINAAYRDGLDPNGLPLCSDRYVQPEPLS